MPRAHNLRRAHSQGHANIDIEKTQSLPSRSLKAGEQCGQAYRRLDLGPKADEKVHEIKQKSDGPRA